MRINPNMQLSFMQIILGRKGFMSVQMKEHTHG